MRIGMIEKNSAGRFVLVIYPRAGIFLVLSSVRRLRVWGWVVNTEYIALPGKNDILNVSS